jgi:hypothetical protein
MLVRLMAAIPMIARRRMLRGMCQSGMGLRMRWLRMGLSGLMRWCRRVSSRRMLCRLVLRRRGGIVPVCRVPSRSRCRVLRSILALRRRLSRGFGCMLMMLVMPLGLGVLGWRSIMLWRRLVLRCRLVVPGCRVLPLGTIVALLLLAMLLRLLLTLLLLVLVLLALLLLLVLAALLILLCLPVVLRTRLILLPELVRLALIVRPLLLLALRLIAIVELGRRALCAALLPLIVALRCLSPPLLFVAPMRRLLRRSPLPIGAARIVTRAAALQIGAAPVPVARGNALVIAMPGRGIERAPARVVARRPVALALRLGARQGATTGPIDSDQIAAGIGIAVIRATHIIRIIGAGLIIIITVAVIHRLGERIVAIRCLPRPGFDSTIGLEIIIGR